MEKLKSPIAQYNFIPDSHPFIVKPFLAPVAISILFHTIFLFILIPLFNIERNEKNKFVCRVTILPEQTQDNQPLSPPLPPVKEKEIIKRPVPLPVAPKPLPKQDAKLEKEDTPIIPLPPPPVNNPPSKPSLGEEPGKELGGTGSGGSINGKESGQGGIQLGAAGGGTGIRSGTPAFGNSEHGTGTGVGSGNGKSGVSHPRYYFNPAPEYPSEARQKGYEGKVLLKVEVLRNGRAGEVALEKSSGHEILDQSALDGVKKWRFLPAMKGRIAIPSWTNVSIHFQLKDNAF